MDMPKEEIDPGLFAPCGMNCMVCYRHLVRKKPCCGCLMGDRGKPGHCRSCKIKDCVQEKGISHCLECPAFPCRQIKSLEKSYTTRYQASLVENSRTVKAQGLPAFLRQQREAYRCPACGGVISLHDGACSECGCRKECSLP